MFPTTYESLSHLSIRADRRHVPTETEIRMRIKRALKVS